jgi:phage-related holin
MVIKMTATTALSAENAYLTNGWNILDCLIVLLSVISLSLTSVNLDFVKALRSLRALRYVLKFVISICCLKVTISNQ